MSMTSGYGVLTADRKVITSDKAGNERAMRFSADLKKNSDIAAIVTEGDGKSIAVTKIDRQ